MNSSTPNNSFSWSFCSRIFSSISTSYSPISTWASPWVISSRALVIIEECWTATAYEFSDYFSSPNLLSSSASELSSFSFSPISYISLAFFFLLRSFSRRFWPLRLKTGSWTSYPSALYISMASINCLSASSFYFKNSSFSSYIKFMCSSMTPWATSSHYSKSYMSSFYSRYVPTSFM